MGSPLRLVTGEDRVDEGWSLVVARVSEVERELTRFDPASALSRLNRAAGSGRWTHVPRDLVRAITLAHRGYRLTGGRFDPRIIGALESLGDHAGVLLPPSPARLRAGECWLEVDRSARRARLASPIDLGGVGKGFVLGEASMALESRGIGSYLLEAGGDVVVAGRPPHTDAWSVAIEHPDRDVPVAVIRLASGALATSSIRVRRWVTSAGQTVHHLVDPATGEPATGIRAVTVQANHPAWSEIWSTAAFVSGAAVAEVLGTRPAWWVEDEGSVGMTGAAERMVVWRLSSA